MLTTENEREEQILKMAFEQRKIDIVLFKPTYQNFVKMLQYMPDILIIELSKMPTSQLRFIEMIRAHKRTKKVGVIAYGDRVDTSMKKGILKYGVKDYIERPIKFSFLINTIEQRLKLVNKSLSANGSKEAPQTDKKADIDLILNPETLPAKKIDIMTGYVSKLLAFPFTVAKVLKIADDLKTGASDLAKVIEADPAISANILKVANTVFFASANRTISSIKDAIVRIGFRETKRIVMSMSVINCLIKENRNIGFDRVDFWYHSLACAIISEHIARRMGNLNTENAFLAGLLHDFGILILDEFFPEIFSKTLEKTTNDGGLFIEKESEMLGINHNDVVKALFAKWKMPQEITDGIVQQYNFHKFEDKLENTGQKLALCVGMANLLSKTIILGRECDEYIRPIDNWAFNAIKLSVGFNQNFLEQIYREVELYRHFLNLEERDFLKKPEGIDKAEERQIAVVNLAKDFFVPPSIYLNKQGFSSETFSGADKPETLDSLFEIILIWAGNETKPKDIDRYSHIIKYSKEPAPADRHPDFTPLLVLSKEGSPLISSPELKNADFMGQQFDFRMLDQKIIEILLQKRPEAVTA